MTIDLALAHGWERKEGHNLNQPQGKASKAAQSVGHGRHVRALGTNPLETGLPASIFSSGVSPLSDWVSDCHASPDWPTICIPEKQGLLSLHGTCGLSLFVAEQRCWAEVLIEKLVLSGQVWTVTLSCWKRKWVRGPSLPHATEERNFRR